MAENIGIILKALLDADKSGIEQQIKDLSAKIKERIELKLKINVDDLQVVSKEVEKIQQKFNTILQNNNINFDTSNISSELDKVTQKFTQVAGEAQKLTQETSEYTDNLGRTIKLINDLDLETGEVAKTTQYVSENYKKARDEAEKLAEAMAKGREKSNIKSNEIDRKNELAQSKAINKALENEYNLKLKNKQLEIKTREQREQAELKYWAQRRKEAVENLTAKNTEIDKMKEYYKELEKVANLESKRTQSQSIRNFNYGEQVQGVDPTIFDSRNNFLSYIKKQYGETAEIIGSFNDKQLKTGEIIKQVTYHAQDGQGNWRKYTDTLNKTTGEMYRLDSGMTKVINRELTLTKAITTAASKMLIWLGVGNAIFGTIRAFQDGLKTLQAIDTELVNIAKVTDYTSQEMKELAKNATEVGKGFGREATDYLKAVTEFARAGMGKQAEELGKTSLLLQNVGDVSAETANEMLLAVNAAYDLGGSQEELTKVIDKLNMVSNQNPTSVAKMADGIQVAASVFEQAGFSIDEFIALVGTATSSTQRSGAEMARGLRTVLMNIRGVQDEEAETTLESISKAEGVLKSIGIEVRKSATEFREPMQILSELAQKYKELGEAGRTVKQAEVLESLAGKRQSNILASVLKQWDMVNKQIDEAANSQGSAMKENEIYMQSWEARTKQLSATMTMFWQNLINTDVVKGFISTLTQTVNILDTLVNNSFSQFAIQVGLTTVAISLLGAGLGALKASYLGTTLGVIALDIAEKGLLTTTKALTATMLASPLFWVAAGAAGIFGIIKIFDALNTSIEEQTQKVQELSDEYDNLKSKISGLEDELKTTGTRIDELNAKDKLSIIEQDELEKLKLSNKELQARIDLLNQQEKITAEKLGNEALKLYKRITPEISRVGIDNINKDSSDSKIMWNVINNTGYKKDTQNINILMAAYEKLIELQKESTNPKDIQRYSEQLIIVKDKIVQQNLALMDIRDKLRELPNPTEEQKRTIDEINKSLLYTKSLLDPKELFNDIWSSLDKDQQQYLQTLSKTNQLTPITLQQYGELFNLIKNGGFSFNDLKQAINSTNVVQEQNAENIELVIEKTKELDDLYKDTTSNLEELNQAIYDVSQGEEFSAKQIEKLILQYPELEKYIRKTADGYTIEKSAIEILNQVRGQSVNTALLAQAGITESAYNGLKDRLSAYQIEIEAIGGIADAYEAIMPYIASGSSSQLIKDTLAYGQAMEKIKTLRQTLSDPKYGVKETKSSSSKTKTEINQIEIDQFYRLQDAVNRTNDEIKKYKDYMAATDDIEKRNAYENKLIETYEKQKNQLHELAESRRKAIEKNVELLKASNFDVSYDKTNNILRIENEEHINKLYGKNNKETNEIRKNIEDIIKQTKEWNKANQDNGSEWQNLNSLIRDINKDKLETVKKTEEEIAKIIKKSVDVEKKSLDDKFNKFKDTIQKQKDLLDEQYNKEKYLKDLSKKEDKAQEIKSKMSDLQLAANSGDYQAYKELLKLQKELSEQELEIEEFKNEQAYKTKKENLDKQIKAQEDYTKKRKDYLDEEYSEYNISLKAQQALIDGFFVDMSGDIITFQENLTSYMEQIGISIEDNLIKQLQTARTMLQELGNAIGGSSLSGVDTELRKYYESLNRTVEWKNGKVYIDGKALDTSKLENVNGRFYGSKSVLDELLAKISSNGMLSFNNTSSMISDLLSNINLPLTNIKPYEYAKQTMGDIYVTVQADSADKNNASNIGYKVGQTAMEVIRKGLEKYSK